MKITTKVLQGYNKLKTANTLSLEIGNNDAWNIATYSIDKETYYRLKKLERLGISVKDSTAKQIDTYLNIEKWA